MAISIHQGRYRPASIGESAEGTIDYYTMDEADETTAHSAALAQCLIDFPSGYRSMPLRGTSIEEVAPSVFKCPMKFSLQQNQAQPSTVPNPGTPSDASNIFRPTRGFNTIGGSAHIDTSIEVTQTEVVAGHTEEDFEGAINVEYSDDGSAAQVRGLDIIAPVADLTFTTQLKNAVVTASYLKDVIELTGKTNNAEFFGHAIGELLFKGATGSQKGQDNWEITFHMMFQKNETAVAIGTSGMTVDKKGWQYVATMFKMSSTTANGRSAKRPVQTMVHTVYKSGDFSKLLIGVA